MEPEGVKVEESFLETLTAQLQKTFESELGGCTVDFDEESMATFLLYTEAGILGIELYVYTEEDSATGADIAVYFMFGKEDVHPFDLCNITFEGYEVLNEAQHELVWSKLYLLTGDGSKLPRLCRAEVFNTDASESALQEQLVEMLIALRKEGVQMLPIIVALSQGACMTLEDLPQALLPSVGMLQ